MAKYEVFLPAAREGDFALTLKVDADNWMAALKAGLKKLGEQGAQVANLLVDIMEDNSIHVTDSASGRVFRIKELEDVAEAPAPIALQQPAPIPLTAPAPEDLAGSDTPTPKEMPAVEAPVERVAAPAKPAKPAPKQEKAVVAKPVEKPAPKAVEKAKPVEKPAPAPKVPEKVAAKPAEKPAPVKVPEKPAKPAAKPEPKVAARDTGEANTVEQVDRPSQPVTGPIGRTKSLAHVEDVLSELFERTQDVYGLDRDQGMAFLLDLVMEKIPAESGSVFVSDFGNNDLALSSARGPKAAELERMNLRMPVGVGIVGFCAQEAVSLAISDTEKDPRFFRTVSQKIGYATRSILCAPMVSSGRTFGCIEVINKRGTSHFTDSELAVLAYVAHQGAKYLEQNAN